MSNRNVRMGVVYRGQIIREEIIDRRVDVSVGLRADSTVQFQPKDFPEFPDHLDVLFCENNVYHLVVPSDPNARMNLRGAKADNVIEVRGRRCIPVEGIAGGSMVVGDVTVMFQFVRGYNQPSEVHERTVLRIGMVYDERLISDRIYPNDKTISIGANTEDTVVLDQVEYKGPSVYFDNNKDGSVTMRSASDMKIKAAVGEDVPRDLAELISRGKAKKEGNDVHCHLTLGTRGRASMGPYTILFQVVRQRVTVPAMEKKTPLQKFIGVFLGDVVYTASFAVTLLLAFGIIGQALIYQHTEGKYHTTVKKQEEQARDTYEIEIEEKEEPPPPEEEKEPEKEPTTQIQAKEPEKKPEKKAPEKKAPAEKPQNTATQQVDPTERKQAARKVVAKKTIAGAFMQGGAATKLFAAGGDGEAVAAAAFGGDSGAGEGEGEGPGGGLKLEGSGGGGTIEKVKAGKRKGFTRSKAATKVKAKKAEKKIKVSLSAGAIGGSGSAKADVAKVIRRKNSSVRRCYEAALRNNPGLSGKVTVSFTVGTAGTVTTVRVAGASGEFASCIESKFKRIRGLPLLSTPQSFNQSYVFTKS